MSRREKTRLQREVGAINAIAALERYAMMDFGPAGFLDRVESDFGKWWAKALTILIGAAIVSGCITLIGNVAFSIMNRIDARLV